MPLLSIVTVVYNAELTLENTIKSVINQTFTNYEYLVIDGKSKDGTMQIIEKYKKNITKYISEADKGIYDAMNKGLKMAAGKWVYFLNAGDYFLNSKVLEEVAANHLHNEDVIVCGRVRLVDNNKNKILNSYFPKFEVKDRNFRKLFHSCFCHQALFVTNKAYTQSGGYDLSFPIFSDFNTMAKIIQAGYTIKYTNVAIAAYDINGGSGNWKWARKIYTEREKIFLNAGEGKNLVKKMIDRCKLELFILKKTVQNARFK